MKTKEIETREKSQTINRIKGCGCGILIILFILSIFALFSGAAKLLNTTTYTVTITDKERIVSNSDSKYLVFCTDDDGNNHVFENVDHFIIFKFNSSDVQGMLEIGETYSITVYGFRIPFLSMYPNIKSIE